MATALAFSKATKKQSRLRMALSGPAGSGKTFTGLLFASVLAKGGRVAVIDTERGSASKYSDLHAFDVLELEDHHPERYIDAIHAAEQGGYDVLLIDSLSHAWMGNHGALELVDQAAKRGQSGNTFGAWRDVTPLHNQLVDAMLASRLHLIATLRSKQDYVQEKDDRGKTVVRKVGLAPVQRDGMEYEFDVFAQMDADNTLIVGKTRCSALSGVVIQRPGAELAERLVAWLEGGEPSERPQLQVVKPEPRDYQVTDGGKAVPKPLDYKATLEWLQGLPDPKDYTRSQSTNLARLLERIAAEGTAIGAGLPERPAEGTDAAYATLCVLKLAEFQPF